MKTARTALRELGIMPDLDRSVADVQELIRGYGDSSPIDCKVIYEVGITALVKEYMDEAVKALEKEDE